MKQVLVLGLDSQANDHEIGRLLWDGASLTAQPSDNPALQSLLEDEITDPRTRQTTTADSDPEQFLTLLSHRYRSAYLRVTEPEDVPETPQKLFGAIPQPPQVKSFSYFGKAGFTGEKPDSLGRKICYEEGKRVPCPKKDEEKPKKAPKKETSGSVDKGDKKPETASGGVAMGKVAEENARLRAQTTPDLKEYLDAIESEVERTRRHMPMKGSVQYRYMVNALKDSEAKANRIRKEIARREKQPKQPTIEPSPVTEQDDPERSEKIRRLNQSRKDVVKETVQLWDEMTTNEKQDVRKIFDDVEVSRRMIDLEDKISSDAEKEGKYGRELTDEEKDQIRDDVRRDSMNRRERGRDWAKAVQALVSNMTVDEYQKFSDKINDLRQQKDRTKAEESAEQEPTKPVGKPIYSGVVLDQPSRDKLLNGLKAAGVEVPTGLSDKTKESIKFHWKRSNYPLLLNNTVPGWEKEFPDAVSVDLSKEKDSEKIIEKMREAESAGKTILVSPPNPKNKEALQRLSRIIKAFGEDGVKVVVHSKDRSAAEMMNYNRDLMGRSISIDAKPNGWETVAHHMTTAFGDDSALPTDREGKLGTMKVVAYGELPGKVLAVKVASDVPSKNETPHITIAVNKDGGGQAKQSNEITNWTPLAKPIDLTGTQQTMREELDLGFTGTDALGREWRDGELVAKQEETKEGREPTKDTEAPKATMVTKTKPQTVDRAIAIVNRLGAFLKPNDIQQMQEYFAKEHNGDMDWCVAGGRFKIWKKSDGSFYITAQDYTSDEEQELAKQANAALNGDSEADIEKLPDVEKENLDREKRRAERDAAKKPAKKTPKKPTVKPSPIKNRKR